MTGDERADARVAELASNPADSVERPIAGIRVERIGRVTRPTVVERQRTGGPPTQLARGARADLRIADAPGEEQIDRRLEVAGILEEEGTLLGEEHLETLVDRHLRLVRFHLAEVRVRREVDRHDVVRNDFCVEADAAVRLAVERTVVQETCAGERAVRNQLDVASWRYTRQPAHVGHLRREAADRVCDARPERLFVVGRDPPHQRDAPRPAVAGRESEALERNRERHDIAELRQAALRLPHSVEAHVVVLPLGRDPVSLDPERIREELVATLVIVESVEDDGNEIVREHGFPARHPRAQLRGLRRPADEDDIEVGRVVREERLGWLADRYEIARVPLKKPVDTEPARRVDARRRGVATGYDRHRGDRSRRRDRSGLKPRARLRDRLR